ncbi:RHS repeat-associated core domain-containing protein [Glycomyces terrestris]|uniref:Hint domain-containing protein n=1 Tax=Glycomyces terrestris TaxID=2493553 RepID=A0A426UZR9_9ACTN|nr:RHS repeat-associated core domain-containing protein [Glycomyces terrestris]RRS00092.1 hypothetical protein EIW28_05705 [Glycomyces terrestris]
MSTVPDGLLRAHRRVSLRTALRRAADLGVAGLLGAALITAAPLPASAQEPPEIALDEPVPATDVPLGGAEWTDPSADQVWTPPAAVESVAEHVEVAVVDEGPAQSTEAAVLDDATAAALGVNGVVIEVDLAADGSHGSIAVDYGAVTDAFGAEWTQRLDAFVLPTCALEDSSADCGGAIDLQSEHDAAADVLLVDLESDGMQAAADAAGTEPVLLAVAATADSDSGDYSATKLNPLGTWEAGSNTGAFTYSIPITVPPAEGPVPELALSYSSAVHDGRTSGKNNQASWVGDGWSYEPGFIERTYTACSDDRDDDSNNGEDDFTADQCWEGESDHITVSLSGTTATLLKDDDSGKWYAENGAAWKIEHLGTAASAGTATTERWRITTEDGTVHEFGAVAGSRLTVPVFGNHSGEPCRATEFKDSSCKQAYRWMLDTAVDTLGNKTRYNYTTKTGHYGAGGDEDERTSYTREAYLESIEYGLRVDEPGTAATARINFALADRCEGDCYDADGKPIETAWPEVPWDLHCAEAPCSTQFSPVFFETRYLDTITTQVREGSSWRDVDQWNLDYDFKTYGSENQVVLWLKSIQQTAKTGDDLSLPKIEFGGYALPNRVEAADRIQLWRWRMSSIKTETGSVISIGYSAPECETLPSKASNTERCYPTLSKPRGQSVTVEDWFHKYVVLEVGQSDPTAFSPSVTTYYDYSTDGSDTDVLWAWDDSAHTRKSERTYSQWRGYAQVTTRVGDPSEGPQQVTRTRYYRGMDGQPLSGGGERSATVTDAEGNAVTDHEALAGNVFETLTYNGDQIVEGATTRYWTSKRASQSHDGGAYEAWLTAPSREDSRRWLAGDTWQRSRLSTEYDALGRPEAVTDHGDLAATGDEKCTRTWYVDSATANLYSLVSRNEVVDVGCGTTPSRPADVLSETRFYFDGHTGIGDEPVDGLLTRVDELASWPAGGSATYKTVETTGYDALGRVTSVKDGLNRITTTAFTPTGAGPVTKTVTTDPAGFAETVTLDPAWGHATKIVDANNRATEIAYDAFGRTVAVWLPGRTRGTESASMTFAYNVRSDGPSTITTKELNAAGGYITSIELYDAMLRLRETQAASINGGRTITEQYYDSQGRVYEERGPNYNSAPPSTTIATVARTDSPNRVEYRFDAAGRITDTIQFDRDEELWRTTTSYGGSTDGFQTLTVPPDGAAAEATIENALDQVTEIRTYDSNQPTGDWDPLTYTYTPLGEVATMTDAAGNLWEWKYDLQGRQVSSTDPDAGTTTTVYDGAGQTMSTTDARGKTLQFKYDLIGRVIERRDGAGTLLASWTYDTVPGGKGLPASTTRWVGGNAYVEEIEMYDAAGRAQIVTTTIPESEGALAGWYTVSQTFFDNGQMATRGYSETGSMGEQILTFGYDSLGNPTHILTSIGDYNHVIVDAATYTPFGEISSRRLNSEDAKYAYQNFQYDETTRRLTRFTFSHETTNPHVADVNYAYDDAGNVQSVVDKPVGNGSRWETQCFNYDAQQRLTEAWSQGGDTACSATSASATVGGPAPYRNTYSYDDAGNRTGDHLSVTGQADTARTFTYAEPGEARPHAPVEVDYANGDRAIFGYDAAGNTTSRDVGGDVQTFEWDAEGNNTVVNTGDAQTRMVYDPDGERLIRDDGDTVTLFIADTEVVWNRDAETLDTTRYFQHAGHTVAVANGDSLGNWRFTGVSPQGTATHSVNAVSESFVTVRYFDPYGINRGDRTGQWFGQQGWVGGVEDPESGLLELGARSYDALFGRFMSIDPVIDVTDEQQINGYAYANHNPVTFADPTGLFLGGLVDKAKDAVDSVANTVSDVAGSAADWVVDNAGTISTVAGVVATVAAFVPGGQVVALAASAVAIGAGAIETSQACAAGETVDCAMGVAGMLPGPLGTAADVAATAYTCTTGTATDCITEFIPGGRRGPDATDGGTSPSSDATDDSGASSCKSFVPGTEVLLADGTRVLIENIRQGDRVQAVDAVTGQVATGEVLVAHRTPSQERGLIEIAIDTDLDGTGDTVVVSTVGHPFWVADDNVESESAVDATWNEIPADWRPARSLEAGSWISTGAGTWVQVTAVLERQTVTETYNLTVKGLHTYLVAAGDASILAHNQNGHLDACTAVADSANLPDVGLVEGPAPAQAYAMLDLINARPDGLGKVPGYNGNVNWGNGGGLLPTDQRYREWDVYPTGSVNCPQCGGTVRGDERVITTRDTTNNDAYYSPDHYHTFYYLHGGSKPV